MNDDGKMLEGLSSTPPPTTNDDGDDATAPSAIAGTTSCNVPHESRPLVTCEMNDDSKRGHSMGQHFEQPDRGAFSTEEKEDTNQQKQQ